MGWDGMGCDAMRCCRGELMRKDADIMGYDI